uniref:Uncharacterized protein n=1 Tax=Romanomermis culicivorax TaxID=13658 RepID=A0A915I8H0_ROMCU
MAAPRGAAKITKIYSYFKGGTVRRRPGRFLAWIEQPALRDILLLRSYALYHVSIFVLNPIAISYLFISSSTSDPKRTKSANWSSDNKPAKSSLSSATLLLAAATAASDSATETSSAQSHLAASCEDFSFSFSNRSLICRSRSKLALNSFKSISNEQLVVFNCCNSRSNEDLSDNLMT